MERMFCLSYGCYLMILLNCAVPVIGVVRDCYRTTVGRYDGHQQTTSDGTPCKRWNNMDSCFRSYSYAIPDARLSDALNFCRAIRENYLWCWTHFNSTSWGKCGIKKCDDTSTVNKCGTLKIEQPFLLGRNITFSFTPDSPDPKAILEWQRSNTMYQWHTCPFTYKFTQYYRDGTYYMILTDSLPKIDELFYRIHYYNESTQCLMEMETGLILKVPPSAPAFKDVKDIDGFKNCIVGYEKEKFKVRCTTNGGTKPITVMVTIGNESFAALQNKQDSSVYTAFFILTNSHHDVKITCSVMNDALISPLTTSTKVYVIKSPTIALSVPSKIREGSSDVITCTLSSSRPPSGTLSSSRPPSEVYFNISGAEFTTSFPERVFNTVTSIYSDILTMKTFKRDWNGKAISCCRYNEWYNIPRYCSDTKEINILWEKKQLIRKDNGDASNGILIGVIIGLCIALAVLVIIMTIVVKKKRNNARAKIEKDKIGHGSNSPPPRVYANVENVIYETLNVSTPIGQSNTASVAYETLDNSSGLNTLNENEEKGRSSISNAMYETLDDSSCTGSTSREANLKLM